MEFYLLNFSPILALFFIFSPLIFELSGRKKDELFLPLIVNKTNKMKRFNERPLSGEVTRWPLTLLLWSPGKISGVHGQINSAKQISGHHKVFECSCSEPQFDLCLETVTFDLPSKSIKTFQLKAGRHTRQVAILLHLTLHPRVF